MRVLEEMHSIKKKFIQFYRDYFTVEGTYTSLLPDRIYIKKQFQQRTGKKLNLKNPRSYTEKLNWLKLYDRRPEYTMMVDKYAVREYVRERIGEKYLVPLIGVWDTVEDIPFSSLPKQFVLKCNHDNGVIICKDKNSFDVNAAKKELKLHLATDYYKKCREWPYKNVNRKILAEEFITDGTNAPLVDYKFFCFSGKVNALFIATGRPNDTRFDFFDKQFRHLPIVNDHPNSEKSIQKPVSFEEMLIVAEKLSCNIPHVRVDLYNVDGKIYFGEMTFYHNGGLHPLEPDNWENIFGEWVTLPRKRGK